eukprot:snap_masked-scaffold_4-processed-gene-6.8-mRNA-1 protein AED:1.00 eAED:1.00 QI:0/-1/0/0/-1/1/1/0/336
MNPYYKEPWKRFEELNQEKPMKVNVDGKIEVPAERLVDVVVHNHIFMVHPPESREVEQLQRYYSFKSFEKKRVIREVIQGLHRICVHCNWNPALIRTPHHLTDLGSKRGAVLRADFLYVNSAGYILVLLDDLTRKVSLKFCRKCTAIKVVQSLMDWHSWLELKPEFLLVTDRGSHFENILLKEMEQWFRYSHRYAISYAPWTNGAIEATNDRILKLLRSMCSELHIASEDWPRLLPAIMATMNMTRTKRNQMLTPNELFMGRLEGEDAERLIGKNFFSIMENKSIQGPVNRSNLINMCKQLSKEIQQKQAEVYVHVRLLRSRENNRYNSRFPRLTM